MADKKNNDEKYAIKISKCGTGGDGIAGII